MAYEPDQMTDAQQRALQKFTDVSTSLVERIRATSEKVEEQLTALAKATRNHRFWIIAIVTALIAATAGLVVSWNAVSQVRDVQTVQAQRVLCPLYRQFINADTPAARAAAQASGQDLAAREAAFRTIREGYVALKCQPGLNPDGTLPRADQQPPKG